MSTDMTEAPGDIPSPNAELAAIVTDALVAAGLIAAARMEEVRRSVTAGTIKETDWRLFIEQTIAAPVEGA